MVNTGQYEFEWSIENFKGLFYGCKSKRPLVKTPPSQNVPKHEKKIGQNVPIKTSPFFKGDFSKKYGILAKKKLVLVSGTNV